MIFVLLHVNSLYVHVCVVLCVHIVFICVSAGMNIHSWHVESRGQPWLLVLMFTLFKMVFPVVHW